MPEVLLSGDHEAVACWRNEQSLERTRKRRQDLLDQQQDTHQRDDEARRQPTSIEGKGTK